MPTQSKSDLMQQITEAEEDEAKHQTGAEAGSHRMFDEFECPTCSAYNPHESFGDKEEIRCSYCGCGFIAIVDDVGKLKLRED